MEMYIPFQNIVPIKISLFSHNCMFKFPQASLKSRRMGGKDRFIYKWVHLGFLASGCACKRLFSTKLSARYPLKQFPKFNKIYCYLFYSLSMRSNKRLYMFYSWWHFLCSGKFHRHTQMVTVIVSSDAKKHCTTNTLNKQYN